MEVNRSKSQLENNIIPLVSESILRNYVNKLEDKTLSDIEKLEIQKDLANKLKSLFHEYEIKEENGIVYLIVDVRDDVTNIITHQEKAPVLLKTKRILGDYEIAA